MNINIKNKKHAIPEYITLSNGNIGDTTLVYVRQSQRAKRVAIRIRYEKVELIIPSSANNFKEAYDFLLSKELVIRQKLTSYSKQIINNCNSLVIFGIDHILKHIETTDKRVELYDNTVIVHSTADNKQKLLREFLSARLLMEIRQIVNRISRERNLQFSEIKLSNNKSSWGSCSSKNILSFNRRLIFAPLTTLHYVAVHEMCHLVEMNHSNKFWNLVSDLCPDYKIHKLWLKENSYKLHNYTL